MKPLAALAVTISILLAQSERPAVRNVTAVRNWSQGDVTRIAIEVSGDFEIRTDRLHNPERVYYDVVGARPLIEGRRIYSKALEGGKLVQRVRVAETNPGVTRVVLDLVGEVEVTTSKLSNPSRLIIELRAGKAPVVPTETAPPAPAVRPAPPIKADISEGVPPLETPAPPTAVAKMTPTTAEPRSVPAPNPTQPAPPKSTPAVERNAQAASPQPPAPKSVSAVERAAPAAAVAAAIPPTTAPKPALSAAKPVEAPKSGPQSGKAALHTSTGGNSLTRALGLKIGRIVIDPGHGGHDQGTQGVKGLLEKDLVLDVAQRLGKLIEERLNAEVIYTRSDDTFVPLEGRTALANEKKADLFLSIHANSSPYPRIAGVETFYLNFTDSKEAMDVASRENATSQKSISDLQDLTQKIALHEKLDESREFANRIQASLFTFTSRNVAGEKNRGVKKAPFVVLIGANMPSVLAEIGFLTNAREEGLLRKPDYRQKLADALYRGLSRYAESLSHFQVAQTKE
jgi:N-acetylmuramoyl-L-alanine amidase